MLQTILSPKRYYVYWSHKLSPTSFVWAREAGQHEYTRLDMAVKRCRMENSTYPYLQHCVFAHKPGHTPPFARQVDWNRENVFQSGFTDYIPVQFYWEHPAGLPDHTGLQVLQLLRTVCGPLGIQWHYESAGYEAHRVFSEGGEPGLADLLADRLHRRGSIRQAGGYRFYALTPFEGEKGMRNK